MMFDLSASHIHRQLHLCFHRSEIIKTEPAAELVDRSSRALAFSGQTRYIQFFDVIGRFDQPQSDLPLQLVGKDSMDQYQQHCYNCIHIYPL